MTTPEENHHESVIKKSPMIPGMKEMTDHLQIYPLQMKDPSWKKTTVKFKNIESYNYETYKSWLPR